MYIFVDDIVMTYTAMAYILMACIVMARTHARTQKHIRRSTQMQPEGNKSLYTCGVHHYGVFICGLNSSAIHRNGIAQTVTAFKVIVYIAMAHTAIDLESLPL